MHNLHHFFANENREKFCAFDDSIYLSKCNSFWNAKIMSLILELSFFSNSGGSDYHLVCAKQKCGNLKWNTEHGWVILYSAVIIFPVTGL